MTKPETPPCFTGVPISEIIRNNVSGTNNIYLVKNNPDGTINITAALVNQINAAVNNNTRLVDELTRQTDRRLIYTPDVKFIPKKSKRNKFDRLAAIQRAQLKRK